MVYVDVDVDVCRNSDFCQRKRLNANPMIMGKRHGGILYAIEIMEINWKIRYRKEGRLDPTSDPSDPSP